MAKYRNVLNTQNLQPPVIPLFPVIKKDLTFLHEGRMRTHTHTRTRTHTHTHTRTHARTHAHAHTLCLGCVVVWC